VSRPPGPLASALAADPLARTLGFELLEVEPGRCRAALTLDDRHLNFQGNPHGGVLFALADYAFSGACNAHGEAAVALSVTINFVSVVQPGARLVAEAAVVRQGRRAGFYQLSVTDDDGALVAVAQAVAHRPTRQEPRRT
jgi:acyl-CoA thioesterase